MPYLFGRTRLYYHICFSQLVGLKSKQSRIDDTPIPSDVCVLHVYTSYNITNRNQSNNHTIEIAPSAFSSFFAPTPAFVTNQVLLGLRKHDGNVSSLRREEQSVAALDVAARAMSRLLEGRDVTTSQASAVRRPESAGSPADLAEGARLLGELEEAVMARVSTTGDASEKTEVRAGRLPIA